MNIIIFENQKYFKISSQVDLTDIISIDVEFDSYKTLDTLNDYINSLCLEINKYENIDGIIIPCKFGNESKFLGLELGLHIRLTQELKQNRFLPILFLATGSFEELLLMDINAYILTVPGSLLTDYNFDGILTKFTEIKKINESIFLGDILPKIIVNPPDKRHSTANEWGAYRLSQVAGYSITKRNWAYSLYTKYLLSKESALGQIKLSDSGTVIKKEWKDFIKNYSKKGLRVLLIDDEKDKGWEELLRDMFKHALISASSYVAVKSEEEGLKEINKNIWDIIFIDLRLKDDEENINIPSEIEKFSGGRLLIESKKVNPAIPVIIFTASTRAWNIDALIEKGADGYYIKESPEFGINNVITIHNWKNFINTITTCLINGRYLKWFWKNTQIILNELKNSVSNNNIKKRIDEKLKIAFGMLRMRQTEYDKYYLFTDFELAFLTYWSCLNEFVIDWIKIVGDYKNNTLEMKLKSGEIIIQNSLSIVERVTIPASLNFKKRFPFYSKGTMKSCTLSSAFLNDASHFKDLSYQIPSYLLMKNKPSLIEDFVILNEIRNHLPFTHSSPYVIENFEIQRNRDSSQAKEDCMKMFGMLFELFTNQKIKEIE